MNSDSGAAVKGAGPPYHHVFDEADMCHRVLDREGLIVAEVFAGYWVNWVLWLYPEGQGGRQVMLDSDYIP